MKSYEGQVMSREHKVGWDKYSQIIQLLITLSPNVLQNLLRKLYLDPQHKNLYHLHICTLKCPIRKESRYKRCIEMSNERQSDTQCEVSDSTVCSSSVIVLPCLMNHDKPLQCSPCEA